MMGQLAPSMTLEHRWRSIVNDYEQKQADRKQRLYDRAQSTRDEANSTLDEAHKRASCIPFGQPILVGHHSEGRDRRFRAGIHRLHGKGFKQLEKADELERRANAVGTGRISSDDPDALTKLRHQLANIKTAQDRMIAANKVIRQKQAPEAQVAALVELGFDQVSAEKLIKPDMCGRVGFPPYALQNNNANGRRIKARIRQLELLKEREGVEIEGENYSYREDPSDNRIWFTFPTKPDPDTRALLKKWGFKWSPRRDCQPWVRQLNNAGLYAARQVRAVLDTSNK